MPVLRCQMPGGYSGSRDGLRGRWPEGQEREVSVENADYLCETFPRYFDRMARPVKAGGAPPSQQGVLAGPVRDILPAVAAGSHDDQLATLIRAEQAGKGRATVLRALEARCRSIAGEPAGEE